GQPSPGYYPSHRFKPLPGFYHGYSSLWGPQHQTVSGDQSSLSNNQVHPGFHDEVDIEFMGNTPGKPYRLQTNVYIRGSGDSRYVGREMKFYLWFDPSADFHNYAILWNPDEIIFFVDDIPIRRYPRKSENTFPTRPMWMYGTIWDASSWATDRGKYRVDYRYQPFVARFTRFIIRGCSAYAPASCRQAPSSQSGSGLSPQQYAAMQWAQSNYMSFLYFWTKGAKLKSSLYSNSDSSAT
ncbi:hypothetical protein GW17_00054329, partial [Ensete ventricosum]